MRVLLPSQINAQEFLTGFIITFCIVLLSCFLLYRKYFNIKGKGALFCLALVMLIADISCVLTSNLTATQKMIALFAAIGFAIVCIWLGISSLKEDEKNSNTHTS